MQTVSGKPMFMIQQRDLLRVRNVANEEIGLAGIISRFPPAADIVVWGQTFTHSGMHKEWERDRIVVEKLAVDTLDVEQVAALNRNGHLKSADLKFPTEEAAPAPVKEKKPDPEPELRAPLPESEEPTVTAPEAAEETSAVPDAEETPATEPEPVAEEETKPKKKAAKKKKASKKSKSEE